MKTLIFILLLFALQGRAQVYYSLNPDRSNADELHEGDVLPPNNYYFFTTREARDSVRFELYKFGVPVVVNLDKNPPYDLKGGGILANPYPASSGSYKIRAGNTSLNFTIQTPTKDDVFDFWYKDGVLYLFTISGIHKFKEWEKEGK